VSAADVETLAARLRSAGRVTVLTGAGVSAASGVPTFRGPEGLWRQFRPEQLATAEAFHRDPGLVWEWYAWRRATVAGCSPNPAHEVLARWSQRDAAGTPWCRVVTQNVDDLHVRAGTRGLVTLHGSLWELSCAAGCGPGRWRDTHVPLPEMPPHCPACGGLARPAVVWFGESLAAADLAAAVDACRCDVFMTVGTSSVVYPAAGLVDEARRRGAFTVEINPQATAAASLVSLAVRAPAEAVLPAIDLLLAPGG
jgi:NAD-dependent deacetylase